MGQCYICSRFHGLTRQYYRRTDALVVVFDVTNPASFTSLRYWLHQGKNQSEEQTVIMILSNKIDLITDENKASSVTQEAFDKLQKVSHLTEGN